MFVCVCVENCNRTKINNIINALERSSARPRWRRFDDLNRFCSSSSKQQQGREDLIMRRVPKAPSLLLTYRKSFPRSACARVTLKTAGRRPGSVVSPRRRREEASALVGDSSRIVINWGRQKSRLRVTPSRRRRHRRRSLGLTGSACGCGRVTWPCPVCTAETGRVSQREAGRQRSRHRPWNCRRDSCRRFS